MNNMGQDFLVTKVSRRAYIDFVLEIFETKLFQSSGKKILPKIQSFEKQKNRAIVYYLVRRERKNFRTTLEGFRTPPPLSIFQLTFVLF